MSIAELHKLSAVEKLKIIEVLWEDLVSDEDNGATRYLHLISVSVAWANDEAVCPLSLTALLKDQHIV